MNWKEFYLSHTINAQEAANLVWSGAKLAIGHACASPETLLSALVQRAAALCDVSIIHMVAMGESLYCAPQYADSFRHVALFAGGSTRKAIAEGRADYIPCFFHQVPELFQEERLKPDIAMIMVSPPDEHGYVSLGVSVDYTREASLQAKLVIAEVNPNMPRILGNSFLHVSDISWFVPVDSPIIPLPAPRMGETEKSIGRHVASLIRDGDCLQLGIGAIPDAVLSFLSDRHDLGIHSEMISDGVMNLVQQGVITNRRKRILPGKSIATFVMGSSELYRWLDNNPAVELHPVNWVNDPRIIGQNDNVVSVNSAISVDLLGQAAADMLGPCQFSGVGGQVDFVRGAAFSHGGRSILAFPSTTSNGNISRICSTLLPGQAVTTSRNDVDFIITEYGIASLKGKTALDRARALIAIAAPAYRDILRKEAYSLYGWNI